MFKDYYYNNFKIDLFQSIRNNSYHHEFRQIHVGEVIWVDVSELFGLRANSLLVKRMINENTFFLVSRYILQV